LGYGVAAFETNGYRPRDEGVYVAQAVPGAQVARFSLRHDRTMFLFTLADSVVASIDGRDVPAQKRYLHERFRNAGWECPRILAALDACDRLYFDRVSQIRMHTWWKGRVALLGDAAFAPSLLAGQGAALAVAGAYVLAGELAGSAHIEQGLARYQDLLRPFVQRKQDAALGFTSSFVPRTQLGVFLRNQLSRTLRVPLLAPLVLGPSLRDELALPDYPLERAPRSRACVASHPDPA
jgi:2-polyprenyl-6-methoxyphenol hydroxylase-like FAD-dependent oxidoreductase